MAPEGMAYAGIVGVPAIMGLYTLAPPLIAYALLGSSRRLVVGPDTATGVISALTVGALVAKGSADFAALTGTLAVLIGAIFLVFGVLRMGWVAAFIATPVMRGFIEGLVCVTIVGQLPALLGLHGASGGVFRKLLFVVRGLSEVSLPSAAIGFAGLAGMLLMRRFAPRWPSALIVATVATAAVAGLGLADAGVSVVGHLPSGLPAMTWPSFDPAVLWGLTPGALSIVMVGYAEALGAADAASEGEDVDANQELVAHGVANVASGLFGGFLAVGSLSKTSVAISSGARTQVANLIAAVLCILTLVALTPLFRDLPHPALAAIVIAAMLHLSRPSYLAGLRRRSRPEFAVAVVVVAGELVLGVLPGIALGVVLSLLLLIYRTSHPRGAELGKLPGEEAYRDVRLHPEAETFPGLLIWNPGGDLFFAGVGQFERALKAAIAQSRTPVREVLIDASSIAFIDSSAGDAVLKLVGQLRARGITVAFARMRDPIRAALARAGLVEAVGAGAFYDRLTQGVRAFTGAAAEAPRRGPQA
jgi:high affinity sulfate transporter 1